MKSEINEKKKFPELTDEQYAALIKDRKKLEKTINKNLFLLTKAKFKKNIGKIPVYTAINANDEPVDIMITKTGNIMRYDHFKKWGPDQGQGYGNVLGDYFEINKGKVGKTKKWRYESMEHKLRNLIREEIMKSLMTEKFASKKITNLFKLMDSRDRKFFAVTAKSKGLAWSDVEDSMVKNGANPSNDHMNIFIVDSAKENPYQVGYEYGRLQPGIIGVTIGKKSMYWPKQRYSSPDAKIGSQGKKLDNYKRYSEVADRVISIALSDIPSAKEKQADRVAAKQGATALMQARDVANANAKRYRKLLQAKVMAKGPDALKKMLDDATVLVEKVFKFTTNMLKQGMYNRGWDSYQTISSQYGSMVSAYENYVREAAAYAKEQGKEDLDNWRKEYVASRAGEVKGYYQELLKKSKLIMDKKNFAKIVRESITEANPDGTISPDEDKKRAMLVKASVNNMKKFVNDIKKQADKIGGSFRSPGIKAEVKKAIKGIFDSL